MTSGDSMAPRTAFGETSRRTWLEGAVTAVSGLVCSKYAREALVAPHCYKQILLLQMKMMRTSRRLVFVRV
jgi:hypothetical protein